MNTLNAFLGLLSGKKTYATVAVIGVLLFGVWQHWWQVPNEIYVALMAAAVAFLRAGVAKGANGSSDNLLAQLAQLAPKPSAPTAAAPTAAAPSGQTAQSSSPGLKAPLMLLIITLSLSSLVLGLATTGCKSTSPQQITYQATGTAIVTVDTAMKLWGAYVKETDPGPEIEGQVKAAYDSYQAAMAVACDAGAVYAATSVTNAAASSKASLALQQAITNANQELIDLENLIQSFGVKLQ
jgi:hypothetical protein